MNICYETPMILLSSSSRKIVYKITVLFDRSVSDDKILYIPKQSETSNSKIHLQHEVPKQRVEDHGGVCKRLMEKEYRKEQHLETSEMEIADGESQFDNIKAISIENQQEISLVDCKQNELTNTLSSHGNFKSKNRRRQLKESIPVDNIKAISIENQQEISLVDCKQNELTNTLSSHGNFKSKNRRRQLKESKTVSNTKASSDEHQNGKMPEDCKQKEPAETPISNENLFSKNYLLQKKKCLVLMIILMLINQASAAPFPNQNEKISTKLYTYELLSTPACNSKNLDMSDTCQTNGIELNLLLEHCGFSCPMGHEPTCVNTWQGGSAYICLPRHLRCEKGIRRVAWRDKNNKDYLLVQEEVCPNGTFQQYESDCFHACRAEHLNISNIPKHFLIYSVGNNTSPTFVYCNYKKGYFNVENKMFLDYDQKSRHYPYFCQNVDQSNPCTEDKVILPNGTCVLPCPPGICRDAHDDFVCKQKCGSEDETAAKPPVDGISTSNIMTVSTDLDTSQKDDLDFSDLPNDEIDDAVKKEKSDVVEIIIAVFVGALFLVAVIVAITKIFVCWRKHCGDTRVDKPAKVTYTFNKRKVENHKTEIRTENGDVHVSINDRGVIEQQLLLKQHAARHTEAVSRDENEESNIPSQQMDLLKDPADEIGNEEAGVKRPDNETTYVKRSY